MKRYAIALPVLLLMLACGPADLQKVAQGLDALATATGTAQTTVIQMNQQGMVDTETTRAILTVFQQVNQAQKQAIGITRALTTLNGTTTQELVQIMVPITTAVATLVQTGAVGIKDPATQRTVQEAILAVQTVIAAINLSLSGG
jgi:hypothetical protein